MKSSKNNRWALGLRKMQSREFARPVCLGLLLCASAGLNAHALLPHDNVAFSTELQQQRTVSGIVTDENGEALPGVTVVVKGTKVRSVTDGNGRFSIKVAPGQTLVFSYIGYERYEKKATSTTLNVSLKSMDNTLNEAVVIGYGTVRKADLAGSVAVMDNKSFKDEPVTRIEDALQGRVSGIEVMQSGVPGGDLKIRVRGVSSINKSNDPLYVVDGIVRESGLEGINPEDIQSMQVLKDSIPMKTPSWPA